MYAQTPGWKSNLYQSTATSETLLDVPLIITSIPSTQLLITLFNIIQKERRSSSTWHFSSVTQSCPTRCDPVDGSMPSFPVHHQLPELAQTHVRRVRWCHPTISSSVIPFSSHLQSFPASNESVLRIRWPKYCSFSISPSNQYSGWISFRIDWLALLAVQGTLKSLKSLLQHHSLKPSILWCSAFIVIQL